MNYLEVVTSKNQRIFNQYDCEDYSFEGKSNNHSCHLSKYHGWEVNLVEIMI